MCCEVPMRSLQDMVMGADLCTNVKGKKKTLSSLL